MNPHEADQKITPDHLARKALVYLRQSSLQQVKQNKQSQRLQYALADRGKALGFKQIELIDVVSVQVQHPARSDEKASNSYWQTCP